MRENVAATVRAVKPNRSCVSLRKVATIGPSEFTNRSAIASQGAAAAEQGSHHRVAISSACNACHQAYRAAYRAKYRAQPIGRSYDLFFGVAARFLESLRAGRSDRSARPRTSYLRAPESMSARRPSVDDSGSLFLLGPCRRYSRALRCPPTSNWFACAMDDGGSRACVVSISTGYHTAPREEGNDHPASLQSSRSAMSTARNEIAEAVALEHDDQRVSVGQRADHKASFLSADDHMLGRAHPARKAGRGIVEHDTEVSTRNLGVVFGQNSRVVDRLALGIDENRGGDARGAEIAPQRPDRSLRKGAVLILGSGRPAARSYGASCSSMLDRRQERVCRTLDDRARTAPQLIEQLFFGAFRALGDDLVVQHLATLFERHDERCRALEQHQNMKAELGRDNATLLAGLREASGRSRKGEDVALAGRTDDRRRPRAHRLQRVRATRCAIRNPGDRRSTRRGS